MADPQAAPAGFLWRMLVAVDVVIVVAFAITAALDPDNILGQKDMDMPDVQGCCRP